MKTLKLISASAENTLNFAKKLAHLLHPGDAVILTGELGVGKTKFTEGFLSYYNIQDEISSPTFNIVNEYKASNINIYHFDVYRLSDVDEFYAIGGDEYFEKGICLIEWGELILDAMPQNYIHIFFEKSISDDNVRVLNIKAIGEKYEKILDKFEEDI